MGFGGVGSPYFGFGRGEPWASSSGNKMATPLNKRQRMLKQLSTELSSKLLSPATEQRPRPLLRLDDGPTWGQSNQLQREEEAMREQEAADKEAAVQVVVGAKEGGE